MNNRGNALGVIFIILFLVILLFAGFVFTMLTFTVNYASDIIVPEVNDLGVIGDSNFTEYATYTVTPTYSVIQSLKWLIGVVYIIGIVGVFALAFVFRFNENKWIIPLFLILMLLVVIAAIYVSNIYEEFYLANDDIGQSLRQQVLVSYMILYSPTILSIVGFIAGIIMFTGEKQEGYL